MSTEDDQLTNDVEYGSSSDLPSNAEPDSSPSQLSANHSNDNDETSDSSEIDDPSDNPDLTIDEEYPLSVSQETSQQPTNGFGENESFTDENDIDQSSVTTIKIGRIEKGIANIAGRDMYVYNMKEQGARFSPLPLPLANKTEKVFVKPSGYDKALEKLSWERFLVLDALPHCGKYITALHLAMEITRQTVDAYRISDVIDMPVQTLMSVDEISLIEFLEDANCPQGKVFVIQNAFDVALVVAEIEKNESYISQLLLQKNSYVILTSDTQYLENAEIHDAYRLRVDGKSMSLQEILAKHLDYYDVSLDQRVFPSTFRDKAISLLANPYNIDRFVFNLSREEKFTKSIIETVLTNTVNVGIYANTWFEKLDPNAQYYAMLIGLCSRLNREKLWELYDKIVSNLINQGVELKKALNYSEGSLLKKVNSHITYENSLEFDNTAYKDYILDEAIIGYSPQIAYVSVVIANYFINNRDLKETRIILASAVGETGRVSWKTYESIIYHWAQRPEDSIRSAVSHSLRQLAHRRSLHEKITDLLKRWSNNPNPAVRWTVAASCERLYQFMESDTAFLLETLSEDPNKRVRSAVAHALETIARRQELEIVVDWILNWVDGYKPYQKQTAVNTFWRLVNKNRQFGQLLENDAYKSDVLPLIEESAVTVDLERTLSFVQSWACTKNPELIQSLETSLLNVYSRASSSLKSTMLKELRSRWSVSENEDLFKFTAVLLARIGVGLPISYTKISEENPHSVHFEEPVVNELFVQENYALTDAIRYITQKPTEGRDNITLILDPTFTDLQAILSAIMKSSIPSQFNVSIRFLGDYHDNAVFARLDSPGTQNTLSLSELSPFLIGTFLESYQPNNGYVILISEHKVHDLEDFCLSDRLGNLLYAVNENGREFLKDWNNSVVLLPKSDICQIINDFVASKQ